MKATKKEHSVDELIAAVECNAQEGDKAGFEAAVCAVLRGCNPANRGELTKVFRAIDKYGEIIYPPRKEAV